MPVRVLRSLTISNTISTHKPDMEYSSDHDS